MKAVIFMELYPSGNVDIYGVADCDQRFHIGVVLEPESENPVLRLDRPLSMNGVQQVLDAWKEHRS
jgi:hypothetical protein